MHFPAVKSQFPSNLICDSVPLEVMLLQERVPACVFQLLSLPQGQGSKIIH